MSATLGASYSGTPHGPNVTRLTGRGTAGLRPLPAWRDMVSIVLPSCCGKSTLCSRYSGLDLDDIVADSSDYDMDAELDEMLAMREAGLIHGDKHQLIKQNELMLTRARRFFATVSPDSNLKVVYCHTAEMAEALGLRVLAVYSLPDEVVAASQRMREADVVVRGATMRLMREQREANWHYARRHDLEHVEVRAYSTLVHSVGEVLSRARVLQYTEQARDYIAMAFNQPKEAELLNRSLAILRSRSQLPWLKAVAARQLQLSLGASAPCEAHHEHNHPMWARIVHAVASAVVEPALAYVPEWDEDTWRDQYPLGPGNAQFAMCNISDWVRMGGAAMADPDSWVWFKQICAHRGSRYERVLCHLVFGDVVAYVVRPEHKELLNRLPLGSLSDVDFAIMAKEIHNNVRVGLNYLGVALAPSDLAYFTYFDCLAGRLMGEEDIEAEIADRTRLQKAKIFFEDGRWSQSAFDTRLGEAIQTAYDEVSANIGKVLVEMSDQVETFEAFLKNRRRWVKPGSATGSPKADVYLRVPGDRIEQLEELTTEISGMTVLVLKRVRLNKSAVFEFPEFVDMVKQALEDYVPNSFTKYFFKKEPSKVKSRALFPGHLIHYIMVSHILYLVEKGGPIRNSRIMADSTAQREDHWFWRESQDWCVHLMLDYANFNETHAIKHMQQTILGTKAIFAKHNRLSADLRKSIEWVSESFEKIAIEHEGDLVIFTHGLLSGWRNTSFTNSILNRAYLSVLGQQVEMLVGFHPFLNYQSGGDDVAAEGRTLYETAVTLRVGKVMGFEFKDIKQLIGYRYREFFRLFVSEDGVYGSLCRMLGSALSGQWSNSILPKFVDPVAKLSSVIEVARKAGRRSRSASFMEKMALCAFEKWATDGELRFADHIVHGTRETGGLGIPNVYGDVYELDGTFTPTENYEPVGMPTDASGELAASMIEDAQKFLPPEATLPHEVLATQMAAGAFTSSVAQNRGPGVLRVGLARQDRKLVRVKRIRAEEFPATTSALFQERLIRSRDWLRAHRQAGARYSALSQAVKHPYRKVLANEICKRVPGADPAVIYFWKEMLELYGCATYLLTEDYYEDVVLLSLMHSDLDNDTVSRAAAEMATGLTHDGYMYY
uniref:RNA-directed RNA polymerase n=1 Tax=Betachrysovirus botryosphaeriae TaxID=1592572 RepID=A0A0U1YGW3_9VIRU|nr:RNA-dependent RNA polymerase [Betachrysovirus botryosphaeriae]